MLASGVAELVSLGAVLPFMAVLSDPQRLWQQLIVQEVAIKFGYSSANQLLVPAVLLFASAAVLAAVIRLTSLWLNGRLAAAVGSDLSCEAYRRTLYQPYTSHLQHNSSELITGMVTQITFTVAALDSLLQLISSAVVAAALLVGLLAIDAQVALGAVALFGTAYGVLAITVRRQLRSNGQRIAEASSQQLKALQEGLGAIREVLLDGSQPTYLQIYQQADRPQRQLQANNVFLSIFPRYALEAICMVGIALLGGLLVLQRGSVAAVIPLLGSLALGAQRLLPAMQQVYSGWSSLAGFNAAMQSVLTIVSRPVPPQVHALQPLGLRQSIRMEAVHFRYGPEQPEVVCGIDLEIRRGERIGLIGSTGSGKSTTVDLLMGLLEPSQGRILVDGMVLQDPSHPERLRAWQASIAHVPQSIFLADCSIAENIAFGVPKRQIDLERVRQAAEQAQIASFIEGSPEGYDSFVGERGIRLSGGQRQRISIARALYKQAQVLVLDEATSALDTATEQALMASVEGLSKQLTIVMIAHRLTTIQQCDRVLCLEKGKVVASGSPQQFLVNNSFSI